MSPKFFYPPFYIIFQASLFKGFFVHNKSVGKHKSGQDTELTSATFLNVLELDLTKKKEKTDLAVV